MKIIIDQNTNKILRYGNDEQSDTGEYMIKRDVDFSTWDYYEIFYNTLRGTFEKGDKIEFKLLKGRVKALEDML